MVAPAVVAAGAGIAPWIPLIATGLGMAYEHFVSKPEREKWATGERGKRETEYKSWLKRYEDFLATPVQAYPQEAIDKSMAGFEAQVAKQVAEVRPQMLEDLAARGVRGSGVSEYPLGKLEKTKQEMIGQARLDLETKKLLADYSARQQREQLQAQLLSGQMGAAYTPYQQSLQTESMQPIYNQQIMQQLLGLGGQALTTALTPTTAPAQQPQETFAPTFNEQLLQYLANRELMPELQPQPQIPRRGAYTGR